jgi:peptide/nickel transport system permease protein
MMFVLRRLGLTVLLLLSISIVIFIGCELLPGDMAQVALGQFASEANVAALRAQLGLNRPAYVQYLSWLWGVLHWDWGVSALSRTPVSTMLAERLPNTLLLAGSATVIGVPLAVGLGILMVMNAGRTFDRVVSVCVISLAAAPEFLIATLAVSAFAVRLRWLPAVSYLNGSESWLGSARALALPVGTLVLVVTAQIARMTRSVLSNLMNQVYIEMAVLKGVPLRWIVAKHALINGVAPIVNIVALNVAYLVSGVLIVETVFSYPGLARLMIDAVQSRDLPVVQACAMIFAASYVLILAAADLIAHAADPREKLH